MTSYMRQYSFTIVIAKADGANRKKGLNVYVDHHIYPTCLRLSRGLAQDNRPENLVRLTHKEHYEAHRLLHLLHPKHSGLATAFFLMSHQNGVKVDAQAYATAQELHCVSASMRITKYNLTEANPSKLQKFKDENSLRMRKLGAEGKHHTQTLQSKSAQSELNKSLAAKGNLNLQAVEVREAASIRMSLVQAGLAKEGKHISQTPEARQAFGSLVAQLFREGKHPMQTIESRAAASARGKLQYICPVCGKVGKGSIMFRHHFANCKALQLVH